MEENDNYYTNDKPNCPDSFRFVGKEKFPPKVKVLVAIRIESKMKKFDKNFVESLLEGVKAKVKWIGDNGVYFFL